MKRLEHILRHYPGAILFVAGVAQLVAACVLRLSAANVSVLLLSDGMIVMAIVSPRLEGPVEFGLHRVKLLLAVAKEADELPPAERSRIMIGAIQLLVSRRRRTPLNLGVRRELAQVAGLAGAPLGPHDLSQYTREADRAERIALK